MILFSVSIWNAISDKSLFSMSHPNALAFLSVVLLILGVSETWIGIPFHAGGGCLETD